MCKKTLVIAEAGVNHNGDIRLAKQLVDVAANAGADYVKFQTFNTSSLVTKYAEKADYQKKNTNSFESQFDMLSRLELTAQMHFELVEHCIFKKIKFLSTAFDLDSIDLLLKLGQKVFKIPSGEINNVPYLRKVGSSAESVILSTGMANLGEIEFAISVLEQAGLMRQKITLLHCTTEYPAPINEVNLLAMRSIGKAFDLNFGYSDHTLGIEIPIAAVAMGASVIEKHITLDKSLEGPDHAASLEPFELNAMMQAIRNIEVALGNGVKKCTRSELRNKAKGRKSIVAKEDISIGELFTEYNLTVKRPGHGISPKYWDNVIGKTASVKFKKDDLIVL